MGRLRPRELRTAVDEECSRLNQSAVALLALLGGTPVVAADLADQLYAGIDDAEGVNCLPGNPAQLRTLVEQLAKSPVEQWRT